MTKKKRTYSFLATLIAMVWILLIAGPVYAHFPWITLHEADGEPDFRQFEIGWGHHFPENGILSADRVESIRLIKPNGEAREISAKQGPRHALKDLDASGTYILEAIQTGSYYSRTTRGGKRGSRADYPNALSCGFSSNTMKALFSTGEGADAADAGKRLGHPLEIVPLKNPAALDAGDVLPVKVLFHGAPYTGGVGATWDGFAGEGDFALETEAGNDGVVEIPLKEAGFWLIMVHAGEDYPNPDICDQLNYNATLTFWID